MIKTGHSEMVDIVKIVNMLDLFRGIVPCFNNRQVVTYDNTYICMRMSLGINCISTNEPWAMSLASIPAISSARFFYCYTHTFPNSFLFLDHQNINGNGCFIFIF